MSKTVKTKLYQPNFNRRLSRSLLAALPVLPVLFVALFVCGDGAAVFAQSGRTPDPASTATGVPADEAPAQEPTPAEEPAPKIPNDQLDSLVAPIALYPDPVLSQVLVASTYPLELVQLQQWLAKDGQYLSQKAVTESVQKQDWDPSIQAMAALPDLVRKLTENIKWTSDLGNAFLAQQSDVMDAIQRMRLKAKDGGKLESNQQVKVETQQVENRSVIVIEQASPEVVYVPSYDPAFVWGAMPYPYPPFYGGYYGYYGAAGIWYGTGIAIGIAWGGGWGYGCGWGGGTINVNRNNNFVNHYNNNRNLNGGNRVNPLGSGNNSNWRHNPQHRGGAPYPNRDIANRFGGSARGDSIANRQANARQNRGGASAGTMDRTGFGGGGIGGGGRDIGRDLANRGGGFGEGGSRPAAGTMDRSGLGGGNRSLGGDRIGSRDISRGGGSRGSFGGGGGGSWGGGAARASSSRGSSSMGGGGYSRGGGGMRGGGGGGMRGGGGRRR